MTEDGLMQGDPWTRRWGRRDPEFVCPKCHWYTMLLEVDRTLQAAMKCCRCQAKLVRYRYGILPGEKP